MYHEIFTITQHFARPCPFVESPPLQEKETNFCRFAVVPGARRFFGGLLQCRTAKTSSYIVLYKYILYIYIMGNRTFDGESTIACCPASRMGASQSAAGT